MIEFIYDRAGSCKPLGYRIVVNKTITPEDVGESREEENAPGDGESTGSANQQTEPT